MRKKIEINRYLNTSIKEVYTSFVISKTSLGVSETTLNSYKYQFRTISNYIDTDKPISELSKRDIEKAIAMMRQSGIAYNSFATYVKFLRTFLHWCSAEGLCSRQVPNVQEKMTVKEPYSDEELQILLKKPKKNCSFAEYRTWVIIHFLLNSGCRAKTLRCIRVSDVLLEKQQVIFRHTKTGKIQVSPLYKRS